MTYTTGKAIEELSAFATDAEILAMNCMSPMAHAGCFQFELCCKCEGEENLSCIYGEEVFRRI